MFEETDQILTWINSMLSRHQVYFRFLFIEKKKSKRTPHCIMATFQGLVVNAYNGHTVWLANGIDNSIKSKTAEEQFQCSWEAKTTESMRNVLCRVESGK